MITEKSWSEFRSSGLLWLANRTLHLFGWAIVFEFDENDTVARVYPARVKFRGFSPEIEEKGFQEVSNYLLKNAAELYKETLE